MNIIHIVPNVPPAVCGLGDYSHVVSAEIERRCSKCTCSFIACGIGSANLKGVDQGRCLVAGQSVVEVLCAIEKIAKKYPGKVPCVVLHYAGFGYSKNGAPVWLAEMLRRFKSIYSNSRVLVYFHESFQLTKNPMSRHFWGNLARRHLYYRIAKLADRVMTNCRLFQASIESVTRCSVVRLPVFSNVGELEVGEGGDWPARAGRIVLFGQLAFKQNLLRLGSEKLFQACESLAVSSVCNIGSALPREFVEKIVSGQRLAVENHGYLPATEVSRILAGSRYMFFDYDSRYLAKSGVFAAAAAHGVVPVVCRDFSESREPMASGTHWLDLRWLASAERKEVCEVSQAVSENVHAWYCGHGVDKHAATMVELLH